MKKFTVTARANRVTIERGTVTAEVLVDSVDQIDEDFRGAVENGSYDFDSDYYEDEGTVDLETLDITSVTDEDGNEVNI